MHSKTLYWLTCDGCGAGTDVGEWKELHVKWKSLKSLRHVAGLVGWTVRVADKRGHVLVYPQDVCPRCVEAEKEAGL